MTRADDHAMIVGMKRTTFKPCKAERQLEQLLADMKNVRRQLSTMIREISPRCRHAVKDMPMPKSTRQDDRNSVCSDDVIEALKTFDWSGNHFVRPPATKLSATMWNRCKTVMENNGAKWSSKGYFIFPGGGVPPLLTAKLAKGEIANIKKDRQAFFTPAAVASKVVALAEVEGMVVLEPSAGDGHLAGAVQRAGASQVDCCEIDRESVDVLIYKGFNTYIGDFLTMPVCRKYDRVVMNPPFTKHAYIAHIKHAMSFLKPGGKLVAIIPGNEVSSRLSDVLPRNTTWDCYPQGKGAFAESGTTIETSIVVIEPPVE